jgi:hypothetical protein
LISLRQIARVVHEADRALAASFPDAYRTPQPKAWRETPIWRRREVERWVRHILSDESLYGRELHGYWLMSMLEDGWRYWPMYDREEKRHPYLISWDALPESQQTRIHLMISIVRSLAAGGVAL